MVLLCEVEEKRQEDGGGQQFFFDQKSLDNAERKRRKTEGMMNRAGKRERRGESLVFPEVALLI